MTDLERSATPGDGAPDRESDDDEVGAADEFEDEEFEDDDDLDDDDDVDDIDDVEDVEVVDLEDADDDDLEDELDDEELAADELVDEAEVEDLEVELEVEPLEAVDDGRDDDDTDDDDDDDEPEGNRQVAPVASAVLTHIAVCLVDDPDAVHLSTSELRGRKVRLSLRVAPNDLGRLIGRRGRVAASIRTVVGAAATRDGIDVEVEFAE